MRRPEAKALAGHGSRGQTLATTLQTPAFNADASPWPGFGLFREPAAGREESSVLAGSAVLDAADGTAISGARAGAVHIPDSDPTDRPAYAFPIGTAEGEGIVESDPGAAPFLEPCDVVTGSIECPGSLELPLFAFASPGQQVGTLTLLLSPVPEPVTAALLLAGLGALAALGRRRGIATAATLR